MKKASATSSAVTMIPIAIFTAASQAAVTLGRGVAKDTSFAVRNPSAPRYVTLFLPKGLLGLALTSREKKPLVRAPAIAVEEGADP